MICKVNLITCKCMDKRNKTTRTITMERIRVKDVCVCVFRTSMCCKIENKNQVTHSHTHTLI